MTIDQMFELAKMGKTPAEIKEFMELEKSTEQSDKPAETTPKEEKQPEPEKAEEETSEAAADDPVPEDKSAELQKQIDDLKKQLAEAQKNNSNKNLSNEGQKTNKIDDIVRAFMS